MKTSTLFICKNLLHVIELSDYGVSIQRRQEHLLEKKNVPIELQKEMSKILQSLKNKVRVGSVKLVVIVRL